jgi:hypothetical protein
MHRRNFLKLAAAGAGLLPISCLARTGVRRGQAVTVLGPIAPERLGRTLIHEHVIVPLENLEMFERMGVSFPT